MSPFFFVAPQTEPLYNPYSERFRVDPYPDLERLRRLEPVHWSHFGSCWVLSRYQDIKTVLGDKRFVIALDYMMQLPGLWASFAEPYNQIIKTQILSSDPPNHTRIRPVLARALSTSRMEALRELIQKIVAELIAKAKKNGGLDLIADFAHELPFAVICEILGIPESERSPLVGYTHHLMRTTDPMPMWPYETAEANHAAFGFRDFFLAMAKEDRKNPQQGFFSEYVAAMDSGKITEEEFVANLILFFCAGHDTVINLFGNGLLALHKNPPQLQLLREDPSLIRNAVEELLRYDTSVTIARRTALEPAYLDGRAILPGHYVLCLLNAGNRDPEVFPEPDRLDVRRQNVKPLSFGGGIHYCLGAQLARIEGEIGLKGLLTELPTLELDTLNPEWKRNVFVRGLAALPATIKATGLVTMIPQAERAIEWLKYDARTAFFTNAIQFLNWERIEGDILEFGVSVGKSLGLIAQLLKENLLLWQYADAACTSRRIVGFDSFSGLPDEAPSDGPGHPRWGKGAFATNYLQGHPSLVYGQPITPESIRQLFRICGLQEPELLVGWFEETIPAAIPGRFQKAALVHIDSDLYQSAKQVLNGIEPILQDGTLVCFDDWFMYRGNPNQGEARAFREFLDEHPVWQAIPYQTYSVFCNSFIMHYRGAL